MKLKLKNSELLQVLDEAGFATTKTKKAVPKLYLTALIQKISTALEPFNEVKKELITSKGEKQEDGSYLLKQLKEGIDPKNAIEDDFSDEWKEYISILNQETSVEFSPIPINIFEDIELDEQFRVLFKFVKLD